MQLGTTMQATMMLVTMMLEAPRTTMTTLEMNKRLLYYMPEKWGIYLFITCATDGTQKVTATSRACFDHCCISHPRSHPLTTKD